MTTDRSHANGWYKSRVLADGVTLIWEAAIHPYYRCNMWHIRGRDRHLIFDTGFGFVSLVDSIPELRERPVVAVGSHSHCDHVGGHHEFADRRIHAAEADIMTNPTRRNTVADPYVEDAMFEGAPPPGFVAQDYNIKAAAPSRALAEGDVMDLGDRIFEVLHLPGHSPGSIALWEKKTGILLSGDVLHNGPNGIGTLILYHTVEEQHVASAERLMDLPMDVVHAGHFDSFGRVRAKEILAAYIARKRTGVCPNEAAQGATRNGGG
jgi:glyoxylase-like metal-dependent hydrolase (beta-lactamase superfamily II)